jgi:hypothetical protein
VPIGLCTLKIIADGMSATIWLVLQSLKHFYIGAAADLETIKKVLAQIIRSNELQHYSVSAVICVHSIDFLGVCTFSSIYI